MACLSKLLALVLGALFFASLFAMLPATHADGALPSGTIQLQPEVYLQSSLRLQKGDRFEGNFTVTDLIPYQVKDPLAIMLNESGMQTFGVEVFVFSDTIRQKVIDFLNPKADSMHFFDYTAESSGDYTVDFYCSMNIFGANVEIPKVIFNYNIIETTPLRLQILSPLHQTYRESNVSLNLAVNRVVNSMTYSLDGKNNLTLNGNMTLTLLSNGWHNITIYANTFSYAETQAVTFSVEKPQTGILGNTIIIVAVAVPLAILCLAAGLLLYFRHRKTANLLKATN